MIAAMDVDHPERDQQWDRRERGETEVQRLDRNWNSLLQELRVVQTGVQLLTGFLLTLPFQQRLQRRRLSGFQLGSRDAVRDGYQPGTASPPGEENHR